LFRIRQINAHTRLGLLDLKALAIVKNITAKRDIEKSGTHFLLGKLLGNDDFELGYTVENKPYLKGSDSHISVSHSHDWLAIILNEKQNTGVDIELVRDKVRNIQEKFLGEKELAFARDNTEKLLICWAAKEAMYKLHGKKDLNFIDGIEVEDPTGDEIYGSINLPEHSKRYRLKTEKIENYRLVYVLNEV